MAFTVTVDSVSVGRAEISWPTIPNAAQWYIYSCTVALCTPTRFVRFGTAETSTTISGLPGTFYRYHVEIYDEDSNLIDISDVFEITYTAGDVPANWRYYAGEVFSDVQLDGFDDVSITPAYALRVSPTGSNPLNSPFLSIRAQNLGSTAVGCDLTSYSWQWEIYWRNSTGGIIQGPTLLAGTHTPVGLLDACSQITPYPSIGTTYELKANFRSNYTDLETGIVIADSGELHVFIDGVELVTVTDWNHNLTSGLISVGWGINRVVRTIYINGINEGPDDPLDVNLIMYQDWSDTFVPAASITQGLIWFDPTFGNTTSFGTQESNYLIPVLSNGPSAGSYHAYLGVGIGVVLPARVTETPDPPPDEPGTLYVTKVVNPENLDPQFIISVGGGLIPDSVGMHHGDNQTYINVVPGTYSVSETPLAGYSVVISVSNGSPSNAITIGPGEYVIVTVINTLEVPAPNARSGIYKIVPGKRNDTLWDSLTEFTTTDVKKPNPFVKTGYIGE